MIQRELGDSEGPPRALRTEGPNAADKLGARSGIELGTPVSVSDAGVNVADAERGSGADDTRIDAPHAADSVPRSTAASGWEEGSFDSELLLYETTQALGSDQTGHRVAARIASG